MTGRSIKTIPLKQVANVQQLLQNDQAREQLASVAASHMQPARMMRLMANAVRTTPKIAECDPMSLLGGLMTCAGLGLEPNTILGHAYLIPFKNRKKGITEVQLILGYKGLIDLARRSGHITSISSHVHYSDDELWEYEEGTEARLRHIPGPQEGEKCHAYAIAKFVDGGHAYVVMPWSKVMSIRNGSQGWQTAVKYGSTARSPWGTHEDEMAKKTAIRALSKYLPLSIEFRDALSVDGTQADFAAFAMDPSQVPDGTGETIDGSADEVPADGEKAPETEKATVKDKQDGTPKETAPEPEQTSAPTKDQTDPSQGLADRIVSDLALCAGADEVDATFGLWGDQIAQLPETLKATINTAAEEARARGEAA